MATLVRRRARMPARIERLNRRRIFTGDRSLRTSTPEWVVLAGCITLLVLAGILRAGIPS